jgi:hypothetical protein
MGTVTVGKQNLAQADLTAAASAGNSILYFPAEVYIVSENTTLPSTCHIKADFGARIYVNSGVTLTVNCSVDCPTGHELFAGPGTLAGTFGNERVELDWFGTTSYAVPYGQVAPSASKSGYPWVDKVDAELTSNGGDVVITGTDLVGEMEFDTADVTLGDSAGTLTVVAAKPGVSGLSVEVLASDTGTTLGVSLLDDVISIQLAEAGNTAAEIVTAFNANGADTDGIARCTATGSGTTTSAVAEVSLGGGVGDYDNTKVVVAGDEQDPANETAGAATWADTEITATVAGASLTVGEVVTLRVQVDGVWSNSLSFLVADPT